MSTVLHTEVGSVGLTPPSKAIVLYGSSFASVHAIENGELQAGHSLNMNALKDALEALHASRLEWMPPNVLAYGAGRLVWFEPPQSRVLFFETTDAALNALSGQLVPLPGLIFDATERSLRVWAYRGNERPARDELLFTAPFFNVARGVVCLGSMQIPSNFDASSGEAWSASFFAAAFTHQTQMGSLVSFGGSHAELWLETQQRGSFDEAWLISSGETLEGVMAHR
jgi:PRTRC genetic system protein B